MDQQLIAVRIKDGIFVGNVTAAHDEDFLFMNKVTHIVNCAGGEVRDLFEDAGIQYLTFPWKDVSGNVCTTVMFDSGDRNIEQAVRFIDRGLEHGDCVLVHSVHGLSRSCALVAAYLMVKYGWKCDNALSFLTMAHQDMNIKPYFMRQLRTFAKRHSVDADVFDVEVDDTRFALDNDQWMLRNTLLNGLTSDVQEKNELHRVCADTIPIHEPTYKNPTRRRRRITFVDTKQGTSVIGTATNPVVHPKPAHHVDPFNGTGGNYSGHYGALLVRNTKDPDNVLARRGTANNRRLESAPEMNPKGRQVLVLKPVAEKVLPQRKYPDHPPVADEVSSRQQHQQVQQAHNLHPSLVNNNNDSSSVLRPMQHAFNSLAPPPQSKSTIITNSTTPTSTTLTQQTNNSAIRSPFALTGGIAPRNGSPLPQQRKATTTTTTPTTTALNNNGQQQQQQPSQQQRTTSHSSTLSFMMPPSNGLSGNTNSVYRTDPIPSFNHVQQDVRGRVASPLNHQRVTTTTTTTQQQQSSTTTQQQQRASSPVNQQQQQPTSLSTIGRRPQSPTSFQQQQGAMFVQPTSARRSSPVQRQYSGSTLPLASATIQLERATQRGTANDAVRPLSNYSQPTVMVRTSSPLAQQRRPLVSSSLSSNSGINRTNSPRATSPRTSMTLQQQMNSVNLNANNNSGRNSPRPTSLAEQYLGGSSVPASTIARETHSSMLRRQQNSTTPSSVVRRY